MINDDSDLLSSKLKQLSFDRTSLNKIDHLGKAPLHYAAMNNDLKSMIILIDAGADVNIRTTKGEAEDAYRNTPLHYASNKFRGKSEAIVLLVKHGAKPDVKNHYGYTPLDYALSHLKFNSDLVNAIELLIESGSVDYFHKQDRISLHHAIELNNLQIVKHLLERGADPTKRKNSKEKYLKDKSTLYLAAEKNNIEIFDLLIQHPKVIEDVAFLQNGLSAAKKMRNKRMEDVLKGLLKKL